MTKLEVFFDYICPYCRRGHEYLIELLPLFPDIEIEWRPCEAHPRPHGFGQHSDLCARGMYFAKECGADLLEYHSRMYKAAVDDNTNIEKSSVLSGLIADIVDSAEFIKALKNGCYEDRLLENNRLAWEVYNFPAIPSYRMNDKTLKSELGVGITKERLAAYFEHYGQLI